MKPLRSTRFEIPICGRNDKAKCISHSRRRATRPLHDGPAIMLYVLFSLHGYKNALWALLNARKSVAPDSGRADSLSGTEEDDTGAP